MKLFKVLNKHYMSPFRGFQYELGKEYVCEDFDESINNDCSHGFYATEIEGLIYSWESGYVCVEVEVSGKSVEIDQYKRRYEKMKILREIPIGELIERAQEKETSLWYKLSEVLQPIDPRKIRSWNEPVTNDHIELLYEWISIMNSTSVSVWESIESSIFTTDLYYTKDTNVLFHIRKSIIKSLHASHTLRYHWEYFEDSLSAYIGSLLYKSISLGGGFSLIEMKERDKYPFQPAVDLWNQGLIPVFNVGDETWKLLGGYNMEVLYEISLKELKRKKRVNKIKSICRRFIGKKD